MRDICQIMVINLMYYKVATAVNQDEVLNDRISFLLKDNTWLNNYVPLNVAK